MSARGEIVVTYAGFDVGDERTAGALREAGFAVRLEPRVGERSTDEVARLLAEAVGGVLSTDPIDASVLARCPRLRVLARVGVGVDTIDVDAATRAGVAVTSTPGMNHVAVAEHAVALMLACLRRLVENDAAIRDGRWERSGRLLAQDFAGSTVGIVGLGLTGCGVARRLQGWDVRLLGYDVTDVEVPGVERVGLEELFRRADVITLHVPLLPSTRALVGERELGWVRPGTVLINTARGPLVDEAALVRALRDGRLAAAGLDVFEREPPAGSPLLDLPNVTLTPHVAGIAARTQQRMVERAVQSVLEVCDGRVPDGLVNPAALDGAAAAARA